MTRLPSFDVYNEAIQHAGTAFTDQVLMKGRVKSNGLGLPLALSGGFAITYNVQCSAGSYAVRVFHKQSDGLESRYRLITAELKRSPSPYFVEFEYQPGGIRVQGRLYPLVKMQWAEGETLGSHVESHFSNRATMESLRRAFQELSRHLKQRGIAHGDLQNGNVIVNGGRLKLIDYDGMFVPSMPPGQGTEIGHRHFQHPKRTAGEFGREIDRFSFIAIDLSLAALALQPSLFAKYANTGENILFTGGDFKDPTSSQIFAELHALPAMKGHVTNFATLCLSSVTATPDLDDFLAGRNIPETRAITIAPVGVRGAYVGSLPIVDGTNFAMAAKFVGDRVELIAQITEVKLGLTRRGHREFVFINFGDWHGNIVKVNIWSTGLAKMRQRPDSSWVGRWISVTGLMDPPYSSRRYHYTHLSVTVEEPSQIHLIEENEAIRRLESVGVKRKPVSNTHRKPRATTVSPGTGPATAHQVSTAGCSTNKQILERIRTQQGQHQSSLTSIYGSASTSSTSSVPTTKTSTGSGQGCLVLVIVLAAVLLSMAIF